MNWQAIGAVGEVFGALALVFVVVQVRHARAEMTRSIRLARTDTLLKILEDRVADVPRSELRAKVMKTLGAQTGPFHAVLMERAGVTSAEADRLFTEWMIWW
jgi:hypothetical protein